MKCLNKIEVNAYNIADKVHQFPRNLVMEFSEYLQWDRLAPFLRHPVYYTTTRQLFILQGKYKSVKRFFCVKQLEVAQHYITTILTFVCMQATLWIKLLAFSHIGLKLTFTNSQSQRVSQNFHYWMPKVSLMICAFQLFYLYKTRYMHGKLAEVFYNTFIWHQKICLSVRPFVTFVLCRNGVIWHQNV